MNVSKNKIISFLISGIIFCSVVIFGIASNLNKTDAAEDNYTYIRMVNMTSSGQRFNVDSRNISINEDGQYIVFSSSSQDLAPNDSNGVSDVFRKNMLTGEIIIVSTDASGNEGSSNSNYGWSGKPSISADGRYVAFSSNASNLVPDDTNGRTDIFRKDLQTGEIVRVSTGVLGNQANSDSNDPHISLNGRYVTFRSMASNFFDINKIWSEGSKVFIKDLQTGEIIEKPGSISGYDGYAETPDGRYYVYPSRANDLVINDTNGIRDLFRNDSESGEIIRVNTNLNGGQAIGNYDSTGLESSISSNGCYVVFSSRTNFLVNCDSEYYYDEIFKKDLVTGEIVRLSINDIGEKADGTSWSPVISGDGRYVTFYSNASNLVENQNTSNNLYIIDTSLIPLAQIMDIFTPLTVPMVDSQPSDRGWYKNIPEINLASNETGTTYYSWNTTESFNTYSESISAPLGNNTLYYYSEDLTGNKESVKSLQFKVDTTKPNVEFIGVSPLDNSFVNYPLIRIRASDIESKLADIKVYFNGNLLWSEAYYDGQKYWYMNIANYDSDYSVMSIGNEAKAIKVEAIDHAGNVSAITRTLTEDKTNQFVSFLTFDKTKSAVNGEITVQAHPANQESPLTDAELYYDISGEQESNYTGWFVPFTKLYKIPASYEDPFSFVINTLKIPNGRIKFQLRTYDSLGNVKCSNFVYFIDNEQPATVAPENATAERYTVAKLKYKIKDTFSKDARIRIRIKNSSGQIVKKIDAGKNPTNKLNKYAFKANLKEGIYKFYIYARDLAGNKQKNIASRKLIIK